jgi:SAM-dependent methyltransferase
MERKRVAPSTSMTARSPAPAATSPASRQCGLSTRIAYDLPFADRFDIVFAIGVIHHLEEPERAPQRMACAVRPGGRVLIWVYDREGNRWLFALLNPLRRAFFSRMPITLVHHLFIQQHCCGCCSSSGCGRSNISDC